MSLASPQTLLPDRLPSAFWTFVWARSWRHQVVLAILSAVVFLLSTVPLEFQRRIINQAFKNGDYSAIVWLVAAYFSVSLTGGVLKLTMNIYRCWVGEDSTRHLRSVLDSRITAHGLGRNAAKVQGVEISLIVAESDPVGSFVGSALSEPVLQAGILISVLGYMVWLQPAMAAIALLVFVPQIVALPILQKAINARASRRVSVLREVGVAIVENPEDVSHSDQRARFDEAFGLNMGIYKFRYSMTFFMNLMRQVAVCSILALGGWYVVHGRTEIGTIVAFISGIAQINDPWSDLVNWFRDMSMAKTKYGLIETAVRDLGQSSEEKMQKASVELAVS